MAPPDGTVTAAAVRDLLTAIAAVLDIPRPMYDAGEPVFNDAQRFRALAVAGICADRAKGLVDDSYLHAMCEVLEMHAISPLGYAPSALRAQR